MLVMVVFLNYVGECIVGSDEVRGLIFLGFIFENFLVFKRFFVFYGFFLFVFVVKMFILFYIKFLCKCLNN